MDECQRMVSMNVPELDVSGLPQVRCGAPIPREHCPFDNDRFNDCPYRMVTHG
jgi:hypothetical protein